MKKNAKNEEQAERHSTMDLEDIEDFFHDEISSIQIGIADRHAVPP